MTYDDDDLYDITSSANIVNKPWFFPEHNS
jgi:hypothetical protein